MNFSPPLDFLGKLRHLAISETKKLLKPLLLISEISQRPSQPVAIDKLSFLFKEESGRCIVQLLHVHLLVIANKLTLLSVTFFNRMIADPAFLYKLLLEQAATIGFAVSWELKNRKERFVPLSFVTGYAGVIDVLLGYAQMTSLYLLQDKAGVGFGAYKCSHSISVQCSCCLVTCPLSFIWGHIPV